MAKATTADAKSADVGKPVTTVKPAKADKPVKAAKSKSGKPAKPNIFARLVGYLKDVRAEMRRVVWPGRPEVVNSSGVVIVTLLIFIVMIAAFDFVVTRVIVALGAVAGR